MKISNSPTLLATCLICATLVHGDIFAIPIISVAHNASYSKSRRSELRESRIASSRTNSHQTSEKVVPRWRKVTSQKIFDQIVDSDDVRDADVDGRHRSGDFVMDWNELAYVTEIGFGTPAQKIRTILSLSESNIFVPSPKCKETCIGHQLYSAEFSTTSQAIDQDFEFTYSYCNVFGDKLVDTVSINSAEIPHQSFGAVGTILRTSESNWGNNEWDGVLGLSPSSSNESLLQNVLSQNLLDANVFSLKLPRRQDDPGELRFGGINHDFYEESLRTLKVKQETNHAKDSGSASNELPKNEIAGRWQFDATSFSVTGSKTSLDGYTAILKTDYPGIGLPEIMAGQLNSYLNMQDMSRNLPSVHCSMRKGMPEVTVQLGKEDFILTPYDYTLEVDIGDIGGHRCVSLFMPLLEEGEEDQETIILGSAFLRAWYGVFDFEKRQVGFGKVKPLFEDVEETQSTEQKPKGFGTDDGIEGLGFLD